MSGRNDPVVLVHGLWVSGWAMGAMAWRLRRVGFRPYLFSYHSVHDSLRHNAAALRSFSDAIRGEAVHFVGHSLGGVVIQTMLACCPPPRTGRVVTLCAPHLGNRAARDLARRPWGRRMLGASMTELLNGTGPTDHLDGREVGVITGDRSFGLGRLFAHLEEPNDGVVTLSEAQLPGAVDRIVLHVSHSGILLSGQAAIYTERFLRHGQFLTK